MKNIVNELITFVEKSDLSDKLKAMFKNAIQNTFTTTIKITDRDDAFVLTGDIPAMWLRDSSAQIRPLFYIDSKDADELIKKVIKRQWFSIEKDTYANAFNETGDDSKWTHDDITDFDSPWVWERKYELDSVAYMFQLLHMYYEKTKDATIIDEHISKWMEVLVDQLILEQNHEKSPYRFERPNPWAPSDSLRESNMGTSVGVTGMSWSGFRPSDDSCELQYLIPANAFTVVSLNKTVEMLEEINFANTELIEKMKKLSKEINDGIEKYGLIKNEQFGEIFAYEVDGLGNQIFMDDANVPSLLSLPYLGYTSKEDEVYLNTRKAVLSEMNPYFYEGSVAKGVGSPHTPERYIWHIALSIQLMTSTDKEEIDQILKWFETTDADTNLLHEGFDVDNPYKFTREWFSWSNSMFCEAILTYLGKKIIKK
ncbi:MULTISPECIES: glycoside hydrolase family 125 protein [Helcococcus]|uniref:Glycoside hydrolase family 125 protein n=1 Tax=Helcococcus bovis TaxID=3153252 RepID=A0ABW9F5B9_9FIRM